MKERDLSRKIQDAYTALEQGEVVVYPTDTVYGLGADATNEDAVDKVRLLKGRDQQKPILVAVTDTVMLEEYAVVTPLARKLSAEFLPGPLTLVLTPADDRLQSIAGKGDTVGFRIPQHPVSLSLTKTLGKPITSTSVNRSGQTQPREVVEMLATLHQTDDIFVACSIDVGELPDSPPSTIVDARGESPIILREGAISELDILRVL